MKQHTKLLAIISAASLSTSTICAAPALAHTATTEQNTTAEHSDADTIAIEAGFSGDVDKRVFSWQLNEYPEGEAEPELLLTFNGFEVDLTLVGTQGEVDAAHWPAGTYQLKEQDPAGGKSVTSKEITLDQAQLFVDHHINPLYPAIPQPGDRIVFTSTPANGGLQLRNGSTPASFNPGERLQVVAEVGGETKELTLSAFPNGQIYGYLWLPEAEDATTTTVTVSGAQTGHVLRYESAVEQRPISGINVGSVEGEPLALHVVSNQDSESAPAAFEPNSTIKLKLVNHVGSIVEEFSAEIEADSHGVIDGQVQIPEGLQDHRYTLLAESPQEDRGYYAAYFDIENGEVAPQTLEPQPGEEPDDEPGDDFSSTSSGIAGLSSLPIIDSLKNFFTRMLQNLGITIN